MSDPYAMWRYRDVYAPSLTDSNLHFQNRYDTTTIPSQFLGNVEAAALKAEINLESAFRLTGGTGPDQTGHPVMLNVKFDFQDLGAVNQTTGSGVIASNDSTNGEFMRYDQLKLALTAAANQLSGNAYQAAEVAAHSLPPTDPSHGAEFWISAGQAQILDPSYKHPSSFDVTVHINSEIANSYSVDAIAAAIEHEITEGGMGRLGSLGTKDGGAWTLMDLFQYNPNGSHDYSVNGGGYFSLDGKQMLNQFAPVTTVNGLSTDLADFAGSNDVFGGNGPGASPTLSDTDLKVMSALGWNDWYPSVVPDGQTSSLKDLIVANGGTIHLPASPSQIHPLHPGVETVPFNVPFDLPASPGQIHHLQPGIVETVPLTQPGHIFENITHSNPLSSIFNQISDILHHTEATVPFPNHTGATLPFSNVAHLDGITLPISSTVHHTEATVPFSHIEHSGLSQSFWAEAAGSGGLGKLAGPAVHPIMDLANNAHLGVGLVSHIPEINSPAAQLAANHVDAVQQLVHPVDPGPVHASFEVAHHVAEFAHQIHI